MANLIIYYSRKGENYVNGTITNLERGNAEVLATYVQEATGADMFQIEPVKEYPADYMACTEEAKKELIKKARPELKNYLDSLDGYSHIFMIGPCWWGTFPMPVFSQIERLDWKGKNISILMTHEGSGLGNCEKNLKKICKGARFGKSLAIFGHQTPDCKEQVQQWAEKQVG